MIRVLIVDDHAVLRDGLRAVLAAHPEFDLAGEAADGLAALEAIDRLQPDVVLLDLSLPRLPGIEVLRALSRREQAPAVVVLSVSDESGTVRGALALGACGYLPKGAPAADVIAALKAAAAGQRYLPPDLMDAALQALLPRKPAPAPRAIDLLSARERQVLRLVCSGLTSAQIGARLALSPKTVETYRARLMKKLQVRDLASLIRLAIREGAVDGG